MIGNPSAFWFARSLRALTGALMGLTVVFKELYPSSEDLASNAALFAILILFVATFETVGALAGPGPGRGKVSRDAGKFWAGRFVTLFVTAWRRSGSRMASKEAR